MKCMTRSTGEDGMDEGRECLIDVPCAKESAPEVMQSECGFDEGTGVGDAYHGHALADLHPVVLHVGQLWRERRGAE